MPGKRLLETYFVNWNNRRLKKKIKMKIIYHEEAKAYGEKRAKLKLTEVKYLKDKNLVPSWIDIFGDCVVIFDLSQDIPRGFLIKSSGVASNYKNYFNSIWKTI